MFNCFFSKLCICKHKKNNLYTKILDYVRDYNINLDCKSMNGQNVLWFPLQIPLNVSMQDFLEDVFCKYVNLLSEKEFENDIQQEVINQVKEVEGGFLIS